MASSVIGKCDDAGVLKINVGCPNERSNFLPFACQNNPSQDLEGNQEKKRLTNTRLLARPFHQLHRSAVEQRVPKLMSTIDILTLGWLKSVPISPRWENENWGRQIISVLITGFVTYSICLAAYRTWLHPLADIPGPRLAAMTYWYEIYYEVFLGGQYFKRMHAMHQEYGPIIRINPNEVHFNDPDFIDTLYPTRGRKTDKPVKVGQRTGTPNSIVATIHHDAHRLRRNSINGFFSNASIRRVEPIIKENVEKMLARWNEGAGKDGTILRMHPIFKAYASDIITTYAFGDSFHFLDAEDWGNAYFSSTDKYFGLTHVFGHFPIVMKLVNNMPTWLLGLMIPNLTEMSEKQMWWINRVRKIRTSPNPDEIKNTIFEGILASSLPEEEKTDTRMAHDAQLIGLAGEGTTAYTLSATLFELLAHPSDLARVKSELATAIPDQNTVPSYSDIETLPYFNACIKEALRLHPGVMSRMPRISPETDIVYHDKRGAGKTFVVPRGTTASMSTYITHTDPEVFEEPYQFRPQRWIDHPLLSRAFVAFSRGSRNCVGQNFALREMGMVLGTILNRYDVYQGQEGPTLELYDTLRDRDIRANSEMIIPMPAKGSHGLRVIIRR